MEYRCRMAATELRRGMGTAWTAGWWDGCPGHGICRRAAPGGRNRAQSGGRPESAEMRASLLSGPEDAEIGALEVLCTDFTELPFAGSVRKAWPILLPGHTTRRVLSSAVADGTNAGLALDAWSEAGTDPDPLWTGDAAADWSE